MNASPEYQAYIESLASGFRKAYDIALQARYKGLDPEKTVEISPAADVAARVEGLVGPKGCSQRIRELVIQKNREAASFEIAREIVEGKFAVGQLAEGEGINSEARIEQAVRTGLALFTEGVVSAPIEGISKVSVCSNPDGSQFVAVYFAGPIRGAGGTGQAFALILADHCRQLAKLANYRPLGDEVERYVEECNLYAMKTRAGQYVPTADEIKHIINNCPVRIDGEPTEDYEVSNHRNLPTVPSNRVRSGIVLVASEGVCLKASKILKITKKAGLDWAWVEKLVKVTKQDSSKIEIKPTSKYMDEIVAGRPIFSYPMRPGGFRLRYGRTPFTGIAAKAIHPATMVMLDEFPAIGTQLKVERPGKGCIVTPCETILGPTVKLKNGSVKNVTTEEQARILAPLTQEIIFLGDLLVNYGDFSKANHLLVPSGYCEEWYYQELKAAGVQKTLPEAGALTAPEALKLACEQGVPLAPQYTYFYHDLEPRELKKLAEWLCTGRAVFEWFEFKQLRAPLAPAKRVAELLCVPHEVEENEVVFDANHGLALATSLGLLADKQLKLDAFNRAYSDEKTSLDIVNETAGFKIRAKAGIYIGSSMGRPEKAKPRHMKPPVHSLFPIGLHGGKTRSIIRAVKTLETEGNRSVDAELSFKKCCECGTRTWKNSCPSCGSHAAQVKRCQSCGKLYPPEEEKCACGGKGELYANQSVELPAELKAAFERMKTRPAELKAVMGLISPSKTPEPLDKGVLRAKHGITVFRDGTVRVDATEVPCTHFSCADANVTPQQLLGLGYTHDVRGKPLEDDTQTVELKAQDIIAPQDTAEYMLHTCAFIDDLLVYYYNLPPFYNASTPQDLLGQLTIIIAPHTSAGILGRIVGFSPVKGIIAHPYLHCATRRNCVPGNEAVYYSEGNDTHMETIAETFDRYSARFGMIKTGNDDVVKLPSTIAFFGSSPDGSPTLNPAKSIFRRRHQGEIITFHCEGGRELSCTPDHAAIVIENGQLAEKKACNVKEGDVFVNMQAAFENTVVKRNEKQTASALQQSKIERITRKSFDGWVYDLQLEGSRTFACGKGMLLTHNCDGDEDGIIMLMDALINFSRAYLPARRGGQMDAPLVLTVQLDPKEVDDEVHAMDACWEYPCEFYEATLKTASPGEVKLDTINNRLGTPAQFEGIGFTHAAKLSGPVQSSYTKLGSMHEKVEVELELMKRIRAVDAAGAAERIILAHFFPDLYGNLRSFSKQSFRCVDCNTKYRRTPLLGKCDKCGGKLLLTINKGGIEKYLQLSKQMADRYGLPNYLKQRLLLLEKEIESVFDNEKTKQFNLADFV